MKLLTDMCRWALQALTSTSGADPLSDDYAAHYDWIGRRITALSVKRRHTTDVAEREAITAKISALQHERAEITTLIRSRP